MSDICKCRFCVADQPHPATPEHGTYEPNVRTGGFVCKSCGHVLPREEVTPS